MKSQCPQPSIQAGSNDHFSANDMRKLQTSRPGFDSLDDDKVQWEDWFSPEINWGNQSSHIPKSSLSNELETAVSQQGIFQFEVSNQPQPDEINHGKPHQPGLLLIKHSFLKLLLTSITAVQCPPSSVPLPESSLEESVSPRKTQSEFSECTPELLSDIISSPKSSTDNETQMSEGLDSGDSNTFSPANRKGCRAASVALPTGICKNTKKKQAQSRKVSPIAELEGAVEAEFLDQNSVVSFGRFALEGTNSIPDLRGLPTVDDQVTTLIRSFKAATGKSLTVSQAEDVKKTCDKQFISDNLLEFLSVDLGWRNLNKNLDQYPPEITPPGFVSSRAACVAYYRALLAPKRDQHSPADIIRCRITQIWLHIFFEDFVRELTKAEKDGSLVLARNKRQISTVARDFILNDIYRDGFKPQQKYRSALHSETRWGDRWWRVASCNGLGALLFVSGDMADNMYACLFHDAHEVFSHDIQRKTDRVPGCYG